MKLRTAQNLADERRILETRRLKANISRRDNIVTTNNLRQALEDEWARLGPDQTIPLVESMPNRLTECLSAGGGHTHY